jgi:hypothetical protein
LDGNNPNPCDYGYKKKNILEQIEEILNFYGLIDFGKYYDEENQEKTIKDLIFNKAESKVFSGSPVVDAFKFKLSHLIDFLPKTHPHMVLILTMCRK